MDLLCRLCGEPIGFDELHELAMELLNDHYGHKAVPKDQLTGDKYQVWFKRAREAFNKDGCVAFGYKHNEETKGSLRSQAAAAMYDILGDDLDGAAAMLDDFNYLGMLDD